MSQFDEKDFVWSALFCILIGIAVFFRVWATAAFLYCWMQLMWRVRS